MKIGIIYVKGSLPLFEDFGGLPTHIVNKNGMVNGKKAHKVLEGLIIPGGSIMESESITPEIEAEIKKMAADGSFILGMCSGFQLLANKTDIGRKSACPIEKEGLGLLDVTFHPLISNDRVEAEIVDESFLTQGLVGQRITGFHCHTYGDIRGEAVPISYSLVKRTDYTDNPRKILSGVKNQEGNVVGTMVDASLDENPALVENILNFIDADEKDIREIKNQNKELLSKIKREIGVNTNIFVPYKSKEKESQEKLDEKLKEKNPPESLNQESPKKPSTPLVMMASTGSDAGKTFLTTGIVGNLIKKGYRAGVVKVGPDIRDIVPSLYLNKEKMDTFSSIKIGGLGWKDLEEVLTEVGLSNFDVVIVEGVMSIFTGMLNEKIPFSSAEIAKAANIPVILVSACNKGGIETAAVDIAAHIQMMDKVGIKTQGVILNKVYDEKIAKIAQKYIKTKTGLDFVAGVPKAQIKERGNIPEVEIRLEEFCFNATETVGKYLDVEKILQIAERPEFVGYSSHKDILSNFK
jgi:cobyric acid synthase